MMLLHMYQIFSSLRSNLYFSVNFFFTFIANFFYPPYNNLKTSQILNPGTGHETRGGGNGSDFRRIPHRLLSTQITFQESDQGEPLGWKQLFHYGPG